METEGTVDNWAKGYYDYLQAPLQPLMDNLHGMTYESFEKDPVKYYQYEEVSCPEAIRFALTVAQAIFRALSDRSSEVRQQVPTLTTEGDSQADVRETVLSVWQALGEGRSFSDVSTLSSGQVARR